MAGNPALFKDIKQGLHIIQKLVTKSRKNIVIF
jgi:hypothetical protein